MLAMVLGTGVSACVEASPEAVFYFTRFLGLVPGYGDLPGNLSSTYVNMSRMIVTRQITRSIDLHVHTPESICYGEAGATPECIVNAALAVGLEGIAITDHNTTAAVDRVRSVASQQGLFVFPGLEISTAWGHVLGIFDLSAATAVIEGVLERLGVLPEWRGDGTRLAGVGMEEVLETIASAGGLAIAAHVDRWPSGLLHSTASLKEKARVLNSDCLSALEITVPENRRLWNKGQVRNFPRKLACVQASDAHATGEIGRRRVNVSMKSISLAGLRESLVDYETGIVFPE